ncbi:hypothetical protein [Spiroplasma endosymbiont of Dilophus febrilis]|uniref:hypothetical protein n=1 Tax=Spiroplasma endosymbiont of Dilophus febrilis TaxID=3066292 RepID=UPI00313E5617
MKSLIKFSKLSTAVSNSVLTVLPVSIAICKASKASLASLISCLFASFSVLSLVFSLIILSNSALIWSTWSSNFASSFTFLSSFKLPSLPKVATKSVIKLTCFVYILIWSFNLVIWVSFSANFSFKAFSFWNR